MFQATKTKGARLWAYIRETSKKSTDPWAAGDEVNGFEFITDNPQYLERSGYVKRKVTGGFQDMYLNGEVALTTGKKQKNNSVRDHKMMKTAVSWTGKDTAVFVLAVEVSFV